MQPKKNSTRRISRFSAFKTSAPLLGTAFWCFAIWFEYISMKSSLRARMFTVERVSPEMEDLIYRTEFNFWLHRNYLSGAILVLWLVYLLWRWIRVLRHALF